MVLAHICQKFLSNFLAIFMNIPMWLLLVIAFGKQQLSTMPAHARLNHAIYNNNNSIKMTMS